jgi:hypothetical protein
MLPLSTPRPHGVPESFYSKFGQYVTAVLSGFDRIRFRATLRMLYQPSMMDRYLGYCGVKLQDFKTFAESTTARVKAAAYRAAALAGRPLEYLRSPQLCKEELAREVARRDKIKVGLIAIFSAVETDFERVTEFIWSKGRVYRPRGFSEGLKVGKLAMCF